MAAKRILLILPILLSFLFMFGSPTQVEARALSQKDRELMALRIKKGAGIHVESYQKDSGTFVVSIEGEPDVGPNITTPEWLVEGIANDMSVEALKRNPQRVVGAYFRLKNTLWLLSGEEVEARKKTNKAK